MICKYFNKILSRVGEHTMPVGHCLGMKNMPTVECDGCIADCENDDMKRKFKEQAKECTIYDVKIKRSDLTIEEKTIAAPEDELIFEFANFVDELCYNNATEIVIKKRW